MQCRPKAMAMCYLHGHVPMPWLTYIELVVGMTSDFFKLLTLLFFQVQCEELKETIQENFT